MSKIAVLPFLLAFLLAPTAPTEAAGLPFLRLSAGARLLAMGEAAAAVADAEAASANPAALALSAPGIGLSHSQWIQGLQLERLNLVGRRGMATYGLGLSLAHVDGLERRTGPTAEPLGEFGVYDAAVSLTYARPWSPDLHLGVNIDLIRQSIYTHTASGLAVDLGAVYRAHPNLYLGLALGNLGRMGDLDRQATDLPLLARAGLAYSGLPRLHLAVDTQWVRDDGTDARFGAEYALRDGFYLRGGYQTAANRALSVGLGVGLGVWTLDYAFVPFSRGLGEAHRLSLYLRRPGNAAP